MTKGILASSTGNVYGIYDLSGGIYEYVAGYYSESSLSLTNGPSFADGTSDKYATAYTGTEASSAYKYGDATYETNGWNGDDADFVDEERPFFGRGNYWSVGSRAGIFSFNRLYAPTVIE